MNEERGTKAFSKHEEIVKNEKIRRALMARNAGLLSDILEDDLYKELLGDEDGQWAGYLAQLEVHYSRSKIFALTTLYRRLTIKLGIDAEVWAQVPTTRLMDILPIVTAENYEEWFIKALTLTTRDWMIETRGAKGLTTEEDEHEHNMDTYDICKKCGKKEKHHHDEGPEELETKYVKDDTEEIVEGVIRR